jgi:outer membrane protein TolC
MMIWSATTSHPSPESAVGHALASFPEIVQAQYQVEDAGIGLDLARSGRYPRIFASYNIGTGYSGASRTVDGSPTTEEIVLGSLVVDDSTAYDLVAQQEVYQFITTPFSDQVNRNYNQSVFFSMSIPIFNNFGVKSSGRASGSERASCTIPVGTSAANVNCKH